MPSSVCFDKQHLWHISDTSDLTVYIINKAKKEAKYSMNPHYFLNAPAFANINKLKASLRAKDKI